MINFENVSKKYGDLIVLDSVDLTIKEGEFTFLTGRSGAGKTTLLRLILKEESPDTGKITLDGEDISKVPTKKLPQVRRKVGFVFQDFKLMENKNVYQNVSVALDIIGKKDSQIKKLVPELLQMVGIESKINKYPWQLSGGEKQRLSIARAVALEPKVIVADEPTGNLDQATSWGIMNLLSTINSEKNTTIVVATHDMEIVNNLKKRIIKLEEGRVISDK